MSISQLVKFCNLCGNNVSILIPEGDNRERHVCNSCGAIQYQNPKIVCGCIPAWEDKILLCRRAIEPRRGYWTVPAGFMENLETVEEGAARETMEEACAPLRNMQLFGVFSLPKISQVYVMFTGDMVAEDGFGVGDESLEVRLFREQEIPWQDLAFRVVDESLHRYFARDRSDHFSGDMPVTLSALR